MKISLEIPVKHLKELSQYVDFDFALAHKILESGPSGELTKFYKNQSEQGREVWLDNSFHELKYSLPMADIYKAADMINATHIVAPEVRNDARKTMYHIQRMCDFNRLRKERKQKIYKIVGSWQGYKRELRKLIEECDEVALPFDRPRIQILEACDDVSSTQFHYFGFKTLDEIRRFPPKSIDTSMPIRAALLEIDLETRERRPQTALLNFDVQLTDAQLEQSKYNIDLMRKAATVRKKR